MTVYRCTVTGATFQGETWVTGLWVEKSGGTTALAAAAWHTAWDLMWNGVASPADSILQLMGVNTTTLETIVNQVDGAFRHNVEQVRTTEALTGTSGAEELPPQSAAILSLRTALPTRRGRGRMYLPPMTADAEIATGRMDAITTASIKTAGAAMLHSLITAGYQPVIAHRDIASTTNIISCNVPDVFGTQRRRTNKLVVFRDGVTL